MASKIKVVEVGARDGLQNEEKSLSIADRLTFLKKLSKTGLRYIEAGAFVSPKWVPQMQGSGQIIKRLIRDQSSGKVSRSVEFSALVPNQRGMADALNSGIGEISIFGAGSESFSKSNINCSIKESFDRFHDVMALAKKSKIKVRGYLSTAFGCPYEGKVPEAKIVKLVEKMFLLGVFEVSIGDTIGVATPKQVRSLVSKIDRATGLKKIAMHFHDTRGTALANVLASLELGIRTFDSSLGGLGGCPYAKGASGNLATEDLVYMLNGMGLKSGIDLKKLIETQRWIGSKIDHGLPSHVGRSGLPAKPIF